MNLDEKKIAVVFKAFCDENRIRILKLLRTGEKCACKLLEELHVTQPTLSQWTHYSISPEGAEYAAKCLASLTATDEVCEEKSCCED